MSVPHLDTRIINGEPALLFGPFAGFTTKFLKKGSKLDLLKSVSISNMLPMMSVGIHNMDLTKYLISEVRQSHSDRVASLRDYFPECKDSDWTLADAGQRVQIIKKDEQGRGKLEFGTELVASKDGSLAALLGASPGASVAVQAMIEVLERCFADQIKYGWDKRLKEMIPSYGQLLKRDPELLAVTRERTLRTLQLNQD
jgi:malate dehydrogenase (quinone)